MFVSYMAGNVNEMTWLLTSFPSRVWGMFVGFSILEAP